jgi:hypothetical protein
MGGVKFFPSVVVNSGGGSGGGTVANVNTVSTGALVDGVSKSVATGMTYTNYSFIVHTTTNAEDVSIIEVDPALPTTNFIIQVDGVSLPGGLLVDCFGWD